MPSKFTFRVDHADSTTRARTGEVATPHGTFRTPVFMPVGTQASVKGLTPTDVEATGAEIILSNTYHLHLRPGADVVERLGGLHRFMRWDRPILTDSGGYQVFSLAHRRTITETGVEFKSHLDGARCFIGPKEAMEIQIALGSDIIMSFDECLPYPVERSYVEASTDRTSRWEEETLRYHPRDGRALFGIVQGGVHTDLRLRSADALLALDFDGYAAGGLFVGEDRGETMEVLDVLGDRIPTRFPRYVMGVGSPVEILDAVARGFDMFDCVMPTRNGRHGQAFTPTGQLRLRNARFKEDTDVLEDGCPCLACAGGFGRAYLRHLVMAGETLGSSLVSHHNLTFLARMMHGARRAIEDDRFTSYVEDVRAIWMARDA